MAYSSSTNGSTKAAENSKPSEKGLRILIVGAGIGGLVAAIALRQQDHEVLLFEQSRFASELGAAIHLAPNAHGLLKRLGIFPESFGANEMRQLTEFTNEGKLTRALNLDEPNKIWQHKWLLAHRVHLHDALKTRATEANGPGIPAQLNLGSRVIELDTENATLTLENGKSFQGDLILGADGVHSVTRKKVTDKVFTPYGSGKSAFRFLISKKAAQEDPTLTDLLQKDGELLIWYGQDRRIVAYPTTNNELLNFVCIHPESESAGGDSWDTKASIEKLLEVYKGFDPRALALLSKADPATLKVWKLLDMDILPTWIKRRLALLGDAAHPFLPHQGQGGACAIEDAASIAVIFPKDTPRDEIKDRLALYEKVRYGRANRLQQYSRLAGADLNDDFKLDMQAYTSYNFGHDEWDNSSQELRKWTWTRNPSIYWRMPVAFGPMPGPRQNTLGVVRNANESTFTTASIKFKTSRTVLQNLFPHKSSSYRFKSPGTVAYASFTQTTLNKMEWLGGSGYNHIGLYIHGVEYVKQDGSVISGTYMPLLFESLTDPIVSGREELGMPKLYTAIDVHKRESSHHIQTSWQGASWGNFSLEGLEDIDPKSGSGTVSGEADDGILVYRYIPKIGRDVKGESEAEYPVFVPFAEEKPQPVVKRVRQAARASFKIDALDWEALPSLHHVISRLAEIPVYEVVGAKVVDGDGVPDVGAARRIE